MQNTSTIHIDVWNDCVQRSSTTVQCDTVDRTTSSSPVSHPSPSPQLLPRGPGNFKVDPKSLVWNEIPHGFTAVSKKGVRPGWYQPAGSIMKVLRHHAYGYERQISF